MSESYVINFKNTIIDLYPTYLKNSFLKQAIKIGLVTDDPKRGDQLPLKADNVVDVTDCTLLDEKLEKILTKDNIIKFAENFEYNKQYRHFCYFKLLNFNRKKLDTLVNNGNIIEFLKDNNKLTEKYNKPSLQFIDELIYIKFSYALKNDTDNRVKFTVICVIDEKNNIIELRMDKIGIAYKNSYTFYRDKIISILNYLNKELDIQVENIDFKSVVEYIKFEKEDMQIYAQRMRRNGTVAYLESNNNNEIVIPILGELHNLIKSNKCLFESNAETKRIKNKLHEFIDEIEIKSDLPMVKLKKKDSKIDFGITHNYKGEDFSFFIFYGELLGDKEMMDYVRNYFVECCNEISEKLQLNGTSNIQM